MTTTAPPDRSSRGSLAGRILLFVGFPLLLVAIIAGAVVAALPLLVGTPIDRAFSAQAGSAVTVRVPNAGIDVRAGSGDTVEVHATGSYTGPEPRISVETTGGETRITGECPAQWLARCTLRLDITMPAAADLAVTSTNGKITVTGITGAVDLGTTNGALVVGDASGPLTLGTTNGGIRVTGCTSERVIARTTNGGVDLAFTSAPRTVEAHSTNGGIGVVVPDDGNAYFIDAHTTNGSVDTNGVGSDRTSDRVLTLQTTNGGIRVDRG